MSRNPVKKGDKLKIYVGGASRGNPGPAASAFLFAHNDKIIHDECVFIGTATNNTAEYFNLFEYRFRFMNEIYSNLNTCSKLLELKDLAEEKTVFLVCFCRNPEFCHRSIIKDMIEKI